MGAATVWLISIGAFLTVFVLTLALPGMVYGRVVSWLQRWRTWTQQALDDLFIRSVTATEVIGLVIGSAVVLPVLIFAFGGGVLLALMVGGLVGVLPRPLLDYLRQTRRLKLEEQLPAALDHMTSSTKAGLNLVQAFEEVSLHMSPPVSEEFRLMVQDYRLGKELRRCIESERQRLNSRPFNLVASALSVNLERGGNLPEALATMSKSLKEIWRLEEKMLTASAEGRKAVKVISGMPIVIFLMVVLTQPDLVETLTSSVIGWLLILLSVVLYAIALWWLRKVLSRDV
jgi:tight adherence protein B